MVCFPLFVDLNDKTALVVGGGPVAARKARVLLDYGPRVLVCAPRFVPELEQLSGAELLAMGYRGADIGAAQRRLLDHVLDHPEDNRPERLRELLK